MTQTIQQHSRTHVTFKHGTKWGFTIVELTMVVVVMSILLGLVVVSYRGMVRRSNDTSIQVDITNGAKALKAYKIFNKSYLPYSIRMAVPPHLLPIVNPVYRYQKAIRSHTMAARLIALSSVKTEEVSSIR